MFRLFFVCFLSLSLTVPVFAQEAQPRFIQAYGAWDTYEFNENGGKVCYMASRPEKAEGAYSQRGEIFAYVTHRAGQKDIFSYIAGYDYKSGADVNIVVDGKPLALFVEEDKAWALDAASDKEIALAIQQGSSMVVNGVSSRGTKTKDTFSLKGSGDAYKAITKACGL